MDMDQDMFGPPSIKAITLALSELEAASGGGVTTSPRSELRKVIAFLEKSGSNSIAELSEELRRTPRKAAAKSKSAPANEGLIETYLSKLGAANTTPDEFRTVLDKLLADKKVRAKIELKSIANRYTGASGSYPKKDDAKDAIERKFHDRWVSSQYKLKAG